MKRIFHLLIALIVLITVSPMTAFAELEAAPEAKIDEPVSAPSSSEESESSPAPEPTPTATLQPTPSPVPEPTPIVTPQPVPEPTQKAMPTASPTQEPTQPAIPTQPEPTQEIPAPKIIIAIDNLNRYEGMDKAYQNGYEPVVSDGYATIVLPLIATGPLKGNALIVTPQLGDPASAPFVFKSYQTTVWRLLNPVDGNFTVPSFLVTFRLPLKSDRTNGVYPVIIDAKGWNAVDGSEVTQSHTTYVTITDGKDPNAVEATPAPEKPTSNPKVIIDSYTVTPSPVLAGQEFTAKITLKNTNENKAVQNMVINASCDSPNLTLMNGSSTLFVGKMAKEAATDIELTYKTNLETPAQKYTIVLAISYDDADAMPITSAGVVEVAVQQALNVRMEPPQIAKEANAGDTMPLTIQVMNLGRSKAFNARVELSAPGLMPSGMAFIGNLEPGSAKDGKMDVFVGTKDMSESYEGGDKYGYTNGTLKLIYEDAGGQEFTDSLDISTIINAPVINTANAPLEKKPETASQWWISIVIGIVVLGVLAGVIIMRRRKPVQ